MSSIPATCSIAARGVQPPDCSWARHRIGITAEACRPSGYLAISRFAQARFSGVNAKLAGCCSGGARRRTDIRFPRQGAREPRQKGRGAERGARSSIHLPEHDVERAEDCRYVRVQVAAAEKIHGLEMGEARGADFASVGLVGAVGDEIDAELALRRLDGGINLTGRYVVALGVKLE